MFLINLIAGWLIDKGASTRTGNWLARFFVAATVITSCIIGWQLAKRTMFENHDARQEAELLEQQLKRTHEADTADAVIEVRDQAADGSIEGVIDDATDADPARGASAVGPVSNAVTDELRAQRRKRGEPATD